MPSDKSLISSVKSFIINYRKEYKKVFEEPLDHSMDSYEAIEGIICKALYGK